MQYVAGEESAEMGTDHAWKYTLRKAIDATPQPESLEAAVTPMAEVGLDLDMLLAVIEGETMYVPINSADNTERMLIQAWEDAGNTIAEAD